MALVTLEEAKVYLRVDTADEDALINSLLSSACALCGNVARLDDDGWSELEADATEDDSRTLVDKRNLMRTAILYALGYMYEHRESVDGDMTLVLRSLLFSIREGAY